MTFTTTVPTKPGEVYLWKLTENDSCRVGMTRRCLFGCERGMLTFDDGRQDVAIEAMKGLWCRLVPAEEVEKAFFEGFKSFNDTLWPNTKRAEIWNSSRAQKVAEGIE